MMAPGELNRNAKIVFGDTAAAIMQTPGSAGTSLESLLNYKRADLLGALVTYLRHRRQWEVAANELGVHRNLATSHRECRAVMGADLNDPDVASTIWLTLRAYP